MVAIIRMVKINITISAEVEDNELNSKSPLLRILRVLSKEEDPNVKWYMENRDRILAKEQEKRDLYNEVKHPDEPRQKRPYHRKTAIEKLPAVVQTVMPTPPADNILRFDKL